MRTRNSIMAKAKIDYDYEATRHMCEGCAKLWAGGRVLTGYVCTIFVTKPGLYLRANQCPMNKRIVPKGNVKVRVGQQKQGGATSWPV